MRKRHEDDLGFQTKISFYQTASDELRDFDYFSPGQWYRNNEYAADFAPGKNLDLQYHWRKETYSGLPMFAMQSKTSGETIVLSRWAADATLPSLDRTATENYAYVDPKIRYTTDIRRIPSISVISADRATFPRGWRGAISIWRRAAIPITACTCLRETNTIVILPSF